MFGDAQQKQKVSDLEKDSEKLQVLEVGHTVKRGRYLQGRPSRVIKQIILLDHCGAKDSISENDHANDDEYSLTVMLSQDRLQIGHVALNDDYLYMPKEVHFISLFNLRGRLYDIERARNITEMYVEMLQTLGLGGKHSKILHSPLAKRKSMMHEYHLDGGQLIRWLTDEEFSLYDNSSAEEGSPVISTVGVPLACGLAARQHLTLSRCQLACRHLQTAKDTDVDDEPSSPMHHCADGSPEV
ncbi:hypothetical protein BDR07DRAFT_1370885 [Suillus spraguei]|nr:hypothetical protein BDR07DRAFT_1370885 [Suillus spraguei]